MQLDKQHGCGSFWKIFKMVCQQILQSQSTMTTMFSPDLLAYYQGAKHLLRYIRGTADLSLVFNGDCGKRIIQGFADADCGGDLDGYQAFNNWLHLQGLWRNNCLEVSMPQQKQNIWHQQCRNNASIATATSCNPS